MPKKFSLKKCVICGNKRIIEEYPIAGACFDCNMRALVFEMFFLMAKAILSNPDQVPGLRELIDSMIEEKKRGGK